MQHYDDDFYSFSVFENSTVYCNLVINDIKSNSKIEYIGFELFKYNSFYHFQPGEYEYTFITEGTVDGTGTLTFFEKLSPGDYCVRVGSTKHFNKDKYIGNEYYFNEYASYNLYISSYATTKWRSKEKRISINELQYNYGAYGAVWKSDLDFFSLNPIIINQGKTEIRKFSSNVDNIFTRIPGSFNRVQDDFQYSVYKNLPLNQKVLTSKIYLWDPYVLHTLSWILDKHCNYFEKEIQKYGFEGFISNLESNINAYSTAIKVSDYLSEVLGYIPANHPVAEGVLIMLDITLKIFAFISEQKIESYNNQIIYAVEQNNALQRAKRMLQELRLAFSLNPSEGTSFRKGLCISNYVVIKREFNRIENKCDFQYLVDFTQTDENLGIQSLTGGDEYINYEQSEAFSKGTIYVLEDFSRLNDQLLDIKNGFPLNPVPRYYLKEETIPLYAKIYADEQFTFVLHSGEFNWHSFTNTDKKKRQIKIHLVGLNDNKKYKIEGGLYSDLFPGYSEEGLIQKFDGIGALSNRDKTLSCEVHPGDTVYIKVHIANWTPLESFQSEIHYRIYEENGLYLTNSHTLRGEDFNLKCEYNTNLTGKNINLQGYDIGTFTYNRCGYIKDEYKNDFLTLSSLSKKNRKIRTASLTINMNKLSYSGSVDLAIWSQKESFTILDGRNNATISIYTIVNSVETLYRTLSPEELGNNRYNLVRFNIDTEEPFTGIKIQILNKMVPKDMQKTNAGRIVVNNISFNH